MKAIIITLSLIASASAIRFINLPQASTEKDAAMSDTMASIKESEGILHSKMATPQKAQKAVKYDTNIMRQLNEADAREEKEMQESIREAKLEVA